MEKDGCEEGKKERLEGEKIKRREKERGGGREERMRNDGSNRREGAVKGAVVCLAPGMCLGPRNMGIWPWEGNMKRASGPASQA